MATKAFFDQKGQQYIQKIHSEVTPLPLINYHSLRSVIRQENVSLNNANIIDVGCADAAFSRRLLTECPNIRQITGVDISDTMIKNARQYSSDKLCFYQADICDLRTLKECGLKPASYDIALVMFLFNLASNVDELASMIRNISWLLKPNGVMIGSNCCPFDRRVIGAANQATYDRYGVRMHLTDKHAITLSDGYKYEADVYSFDDSKTDDDAKGNFMHFDSSYFYTNHSFNRLGKSVGFGAWKWYNPIIPDIVKTKHSSIDWNSYVDHAPDMFFCVRKSAQTRSRL